MRSVSCAGCGLVGWADAGNCKRCGMPLPVNRQPPPMVAPPPPPDYNAGYNAGYNHNYGPRPGDSGAAKKRTGYAVASLVIGILGFFTFGILLIGTIIGTSLGIAALKKESSQPALYGGKGLAIAGIVMNLLAVCMVVPLGIVTAIAIPNLLASRKAANEASAIASLRVIGNAQATYASTTGTGNYASLTQLFGARMIDENLASGTKNGYVFTVTVNGNGFEATATPVSRSTGNRSFYVSANGVIRYAPGMRPATETDPPINANGSPYGSPYDSQYDSQTRGTSSQPGWQGTAPAY